jgi:hypothetical protein
MTQEKIDIKDFSLVATENNFMSEDNDLSISRPGLWPSEASVEYQDDYGTVVIGKCLRAVFYRALNFDKDKSPDPGLTMKGDMGKRAEESCIERWKKMGIWYANNVKFYNHDLVVSGELDVVIKLEKYEFISARIGIECKSFYGHAANMEICGGKRPPKPGKPKIDHFLQTILYKEKYKDILDQYRLYYIERGDGHRVEFEVGLTEDQPWWRQIPGPYWSYFEPEEVVTPFKLSDIHKRFKTLIQHIRERTLPPKDYNLVYSPEQVEIEWLRGNIGKTKYEAWKKKHEGNEITNWNCSYCQFKNRCHQDG